MDLHGKTGKIQVLPPPSFREIGPRSSKFQ